MRDLERLRAYATKHLNQEGYAPDAEDLAEALALSAEAVEALLEALREVDPTLADLIEL